MGRLGIKTAVFGFLCNFILFLLKLYVGISASSLAIYCDAINNLGDTLSCIIALAGFFLVLKMDEKRGGRAQSLAGFVIGLILAFTGAYCTYNGFERLAYPVSLAYTNKYAVLVGVTVFVKLAMGLIYLRINRKQKSTVIKALIADSFMDCGITCAVLMSFYLSSRINFAIDGFVSIIIGIAVASGAIKNIIAEAKHLINDD